MPLVAFLPIEDERVRSTIPAIEWNLMRNGFVMRYAPLAENSEGAFLTEAADFVCPRCSSRYKFVRVRTEPGHPSLLVNCRVCKEPFPSMDGEYARKYFLVNRARRRNGIDSA